MIDKLLRLDPKVQIALGLVMLIIGLLAIRLGAKMKTPRKSGAITEH